MSIAANLQQNTAQLRTLIERGNGDILHLGPAVLDSLEAEIERVQGLEEVALIDGDQEKAVA